MRVVNAQIFITFPSMVLRTSNAAANTPISNMMGLKRTAKTVLAKSLFQIGPVHVDSSSATIKQYPNTNNKRKRKEKL